MRIHRDANMFIHKATHMRIHNDANMSFHKDRQSRPIIGATGWGRISLPAQPPSVFTKCPLPAPAVGAPCTTSQSPPCQGSAPRGAHPSAGPTPPRPRALPIWDCPTFPAPPTSAQPWNPEPLAGNHNECAQLSAVIIKANTNADNPTTRAVMFHLGTYIPQGVPDTFGFNGIDTSQCTGDTIALTYPSGISGLVSVVKFRWNGNGVELTTPELTTATPVPLPPVSGPLGSRLT
jgi:hypothetical protein